MGTELKNPNTLLAIPDGFRQTALAFPGKIRQAVAMLDDADTLNEMLAKADAMTAYTKHLHDSAEINNAIQFGRLAIEAGLGRVMAPKTMPAAGAMGGAGNKKSSGAPYPSFSENTLKVCRKIHKNSEKLAGYEDQIKTHNEALADDSPDAIQASTAGFIRFATGTEKAGTAAHVSENTGIPEWYTPDEYLDAARKALGEIDLDPASSAIAQERVKAKKYYTLEQDGLSKPWAGRVFLNPPYSSDLVGRFTGQLCESLDSGGVTAAVLLVNNATETAWFQEAAEIATALCFPAGRIKFLDEDGNPGAPLQGQAFMYFGKATKRFLPAFNDFGLCVIRQ